MNTFLYDVAKRLVDEHPHDLERVTVVFNNRRPGLFLRRNLKSLLGETFFAPYIIGIDDLIYQMGQLELVPNEFLLFELFDIHRQLGGDNRKYQTLEEFISFGDMMIGDFSEIDLYCVDAQDLFTNLYDLKTIGEWDVEGDHLSPQQQNYLAFYKSLYQYYNLLHQRLITQRKAYRGMAYREVAEHIDLLADRIDDGHIYFVGFNTLSKCESIIINTLVRRGKATLIADGDDHYFKKEHQEAGLLLSKLAETFPDIGPFPNHFLEGHKNITIVDCPENTLQAKYAGQLIHQVLTGTDETSIPLEQTALVLADEQLLVPVLNSLPDEVKGANVSMGFPFLLTHTYNLTIKLFELYQRRSQKRFHQKELLDVLTDDLIGNIIHTQNLHSLLVRQLVNRPIVYADADDIRALLNAVDIDPTPLMFLFDQESESPDQIITLLRQLAQTLYDCPEMEHNKKEREALFCLQQTLDYFTEIQFQYHAIDTLSAMQKVYTRIAKRRSVALYGEPLTGLQILGMLESRNLDFKRVILLSVNEGVLPSGRGSNTLIPFELKIHANIPTYKEKDAVYANHFYSLIQRAEDVTLIYSSESESMGKGEASRFIFQIEEEMSKEPYSSHITFNRLKVSVNNTSSEQNPTATSIPKSTEVVNQLQHMAERGFAPTALNKYRSCPMKFYYEDVLKLCNNDSISDELDNSGLGKCVHSILEHIFQIDSDGIVKAETLEAQLDHIDELVDKEIEEQFHHAQIQEGRNGFMAAVAKMQITNVLKKEIAFIRNGAQLRIVQLEEFLDCPLTIQIAGETRSIKIKGKADRIDLCNEQLRIVDYKSGKVDASKLQTTDNKFNERNLSDQWFQVMQYAWIYKQGHPETPAIISGIYPLGAFGTGFLEASWGGESVISQQHFKQFEAYLQEMVGAIMNPSIPFDCTPTKDACKYCAMKELCPVAVKGNESRG